MHIYFNIHFRKKNICVSLYLHRSVNNYVKLLSVNRKYELTKAVYYYYYYFVIIVTISRAFKLLINIT